jgi:hypothetical protein
MGQILNACDKKSSSRMLGGRKLHYSGLPNSGEGDSVKRRASVMFRKLLGKIEHGKP